MVYKTEAPSSTLWSKFLFESKPPEVTKTGFFNEYLFENGRITGKRRNSMSGGASSKEISYRNDNGIFICKIKEGYTLVKIIDRSGTIVWRYQSSSKKGFNVNTVLQKFIDFTHN